MDLDTLQTTLLKSGPDAAADALCESLRQAEDYHALFYALLMKARVKLGVSPFPTGPATDLPAEAHEPYEDAIRQAAREVGNIYLGKQDIPRAWGFFRLINEPQPVIDALNTVQPGPDDDTYPLLDIAWHQRVSPRRGFDILLDRNGICSAITTLGQTDLSNDIPLRVDCISKLVVALHEQLRERLINDWTERNLTVPSDTAIPKLLRDELFVDEVYHVDVSHLASVVQMALELPPGPALNQARELCAYGRWLAPGFRGDGDSPFENNYDDYAVYLAVIAGENVDAGLKHFEAKIAAELPEGNTFPAEVFINLLVRLNRDQDALAAAKTYLAEVPLEATLSCPGIADLARKVGDYAGLADAARAKGDAVQYLAGLIAATKAG
ncbi:hypothetical protein BH11PLA2_BH11PLA2_21980 [soil metagenome]